MPEFLSVKEAAKLTGRSPSSIRRVIYPILDNDQHADRHHIQPSVEEVLQLRLKGENFAWRLSEELLRREVPVVEPNIKSGDDAQSESVQGRDDGLLGMLRRELNIKNVQITQQSELIGKQMELISGLSERLREGNHLIGSLQQQLALNDGTERSKQAIVDSSSENKEKESPMQKTKRKWFTWTRS